MLFRSNIAIHEAGHVVIAEVFYPGSVNLVSICKYESSHGGYVSYQKINEYAKTSDVLEKVVMRSLGGKAAIEVVCGQVCVGCTDDVGDAFRLVSKLVDDFCAYGFEIFTYRQSSEWLLAKNNQLVAKEVNRYYQDRKSVV